MSRLEDARLERIRYVVEQRGGPGDAKSSFDVHENRKHRRGLRLPSGRLYPDLYLQLRPDA